MRSEWKIEYLSGSCFSRTGRICTPMAEPPVLLPGDFWPPHQLSPVEVSGRASWSSLRPASAEVLRTQTRECRGRVLASKGVWWQEGQWTPRWFMPCACYPSGPEGPGRWPCPYKAGCVCVSSGEGNPCGVGCLGFRRGGVTLGCFRRCGVEATGETLRWTSVLSGRAFPDEARLC